MWAKPINSAFCVIFFSILDSYMDQAQFSFHLWNATWPKPIFFRFSLLISGPSLSTVRLFIYFHFSWQFGGSQLSDSWQSVLMVRFLTVGPNHQVRISSQIINNQYTNQEGESEHMKNFKKQPKSAYYKIFHTLVHIRISWPSKPWN
jgi:hypothetical protein